MTYTEKGAGDTGARGASAVSYGDPLPWTWKQLFLVSLHLPVRDNRGRIMRYRDTYDRLVSEIRIQIDLVRELTGEVIRHADEAGVPVRSRGLRIDSHQHTHLLPIVWRAFMQVVEEDRLEVEYVRSSHEPLGVFVRHLGLVSRHPVGFIKNRILAVLAPRVERYIRDNKLRSTYLWGLVMTGYMDIDRIDAIMPDMLNVCTKYGRDLEINIHPGRMNPDEVSEEIPAPSVEDFYMTGGREIELNTVAHFREVMSKYADR